MTIPLRRFRFPRNECPMQPAGPPQSCLCGDPPHAHIPQCTGCGTCPELEFDDGTDGPRPLAMSGPLMHIADEPQPGNIHRRGGGQ